MRKILSLLLLTFIFVGSISAEIILPPLVGDNMVLQRDASVAIWGAAEANEDVIINCEWLNNSIKIITDSKGKWSTAIDTPSAGGPYSLTIETSNDKKEIKNILIGDVWFCSGQSNMDQPVRGFSNQPTQWAMKEVLNSNQNKTVRLFKVPRVLSDEKVEDVGGEWKMCNPESVAEISAVAYFFAKQVSSTLEVPIGIIVSAWGGTSILGWMPRESSDVVLGCERRKQLDSTQTKEHNISSLLFNAMIEPASKYSIKGFLWYQGESNHKMPDEYAKLMPAMVSKWRECWSDTNNQLGFYFVQIAPYAYGGNSNKFQVPIFVTAQMKAESVIPNCYMATTTDIGEELCIHPPYKKEVGERLASLALQHTYKLKGVNFADYPRLKNVVFKDNLATVEMESRYGVNFGYIKGFELAGVDGVYHPAVGVVDRYSKNIIKVTSDRVSSPVAVRYAYRNYIEATLKSPFGIPAPPFLYNKLEIE